MKKNNIIIGIDSCGLGCVAGPLYVAAVVFPEGLVINGVRDSKKIAPGKRLSLLPKIEEQSLFWFLSVSLTKTIDKYGIAECDRYGMSLCAQAALLYFTEAMVIVDGINKLDGVPDDQQKAVKGGDDKFQAVGAASILAKTQRDKRMEEIGVKYPQYLFQKHKGYFTTDHKDSLEKYGVCPEHRRTTGPVSKVMQQNA
jgi:ribonuclease HII